MTKNLLRAWSIAIVLSSIAFQGNAASGIFQTYVVLNINNGGNQSFAGGENSDPGLPYNGIAFGQINGLILNGGEVKTFKNGGSDVFGAEIFYNLHIASEPAGAFTAINLPFDSNLPNPGDQKWLQAAAGIDIFTGLSSGTYALEVYWKATSTDGDHFDSDGGNNFKATFIIPEINENCTSALGLTPSVFGVAGWQTFSLGEISSDAGCIGVADDDVWFSFVAQSPNDIILAQDPTGSYDAVIEIYSDCGNQIACFDNYGAGEIERALSAAPPSGVPFVAGVTYYFRVYNKAFGTIGSSDIRVMVKTFEEGGLKPTSCGVLDFDLTDQIWSLNDGSGQLYSNPAVGVSNYRFRFRETSDGTTYNGGLDVTVEGPNGSHGVQLDDVPGLAYGNQYLVSVGHKVGLPANGTLDFFWSGFSAECLIGLEATVPTTTLGAAFCPVSMTNLFLTDQINAVPVLGADQYEFTFDGPGGPFVKISSNYNVILSTVGSIADGLQYNSATYDVTVRARVNGEWSIPGIPCTIGMQAQPEGSQLLASSCGMDVDLPGNSTLTAMNVKGATSYQFKFTPLSGQTSGELTKTRPTRVFQFANTTMPFESGLYSVEVRVLAGDTWGTFTDVDPDCTVNIIETGEMAPPIVDVLNTKLNQTTDMGVRIYPNPNNGQEFRVSIDGLTENGTADIYLRDIQGRLIDSRTYVYNEKSTFIWRSTSTLESGVYILETRLGGISQTSLFSVR